MNKRKLYGVLNSETVFDYDQFHLLPIDKISLDSHHITKGYEQPDGKCQWTIGRGGYGTNKDEWSIDIFFDDGTSQVFIFPPFLNAIFRYMEEQGREEIRDKFREIINGRV